MRFITAARVIELSFSNKTNETNLIKDSIIEAAQLRWIKPMLGDTLWDLMESEWDTNGDATGYSTANAALATKLEKPLAFFVKYEIIPDMSVNTTAAGLQVLTTEFTNPATDKQRGQIQDQALSHAKSLLNEITRWLEKSAQSTTYPTYYASDNINNNTPIAGGILF